MSETSPVCIDSLVKLIAAVWATFQLGAPQLAHLSVIIYLHDDQLLTLQRHNHWVDTEILDRHTIFVRHTTTW